MNKSFLKRNLSKINFFVFLFISTLTIEAQVCLNGWDYRRTIIVDNSLNSNALGEFQINFEINTAVLISNNAMNIDGDDIRILNKNGVMLPYYIEKGTINTSTTKIWVRLDTINALSIDSIFLFYGSAIALPLNNPEATFDFFDDFDLSTLDALKWDFCNGAGGTNSLLAGNITLSSTVLTTGRAIIKTKKTFGFPIISEANIKSITNGNVVLGQVNSIDKGYGMMYDSATFTTMRAMELDNVICQNLSEISPITNVQALQKYGIWQFSWTKQANQMSCIKIKIQAK